MPWPRARWNVAASPDAELVRRLTTELALPSALAGALAGRGFDSPREVRRLLSPRLEHLVPPEQVPGIPAAVERIGDAVRRREAILVFGDFDADGLTAAFVLARVLEALGATVEIFIPDREREGYGLTPRAVARALDRHPATRLLVTVDCGITQCEGCAVCRGRGVEVVITDHHCLGPELPDAVARIDPWLPNTPPELRHLAGAGVAFKLAHALARQPAGGHALDLTSLLPAVALGTVSDMAPLLGENRILVASGLARLNAGASVGLSALAGVARAQPPLVAEDLAFRLGPRINAAGRIGDPRLALSLLRSTDTDTANTLAQTLDSLNRERRRLESETCACALRRSPGLRDVQASGAAVLCDASWHPGVLGLVASRLARQFGVPVVVLTHDGQGLVRGSGRCPPRGHFDLPALFHACKDCLEHYGGHRAAAGVTLRAEALETFQSAFAAACRAAQGEPDPRPVLDLDGWLSAGQITLTLHEQTQRLAPFGIGMSAPRWGIRNVACTRAPTQTGSREWQLALRTPEGLDLSGWLFDATEPPPSDWSNGRPHDIACVTRRGFREGVPELQLVLHDLRTSTAARDPA